MKNKLKDEIFIGIVEDNNDPKKKGRVKVRVQTIYDSIPTSDIPWATPFKDLNGNQFNLPEKGKIVSVIFNKGNIYKPEFIYAEHYNINLENKIKALSDKGYASMKAVIFDHKTQIYSNDDDGLVMDYKFNNINILENSMNLNLKDNNSILNLGYKTANQQAVLGTAYFEWLDKFIDALSQNTAFLGNLGSPVLAAPGLLQLIAEYKANKDEKYLSHHVNIVENNQITKNDRPANGQLGDSWASTTTQNNLSTLENINYPKDGIKQNVDDPSYVAPSTDGTPDSVIPNGGTYSNPSLSDPKSVPQLDKIIRYMKSKSFIVYEEQYKLNIIAFRNKDNGSVSNKFDETLVVFFINENNTWVSYNYHITTVPGYKPGTSVLPDNVAILQLGQYVDQYKIGLHQNRPGYNCLKFADSIVYRDSTNKSYDYTSQKQRGSFGINIHHAGDPQSENVNNWSEGCQVFKNINAFNEFMKYCNNQISIAKKSTFTYTLVQKSDFDSFT